MTVIVEIDSALGQLYQSATGTGSAILGSLEELDPFLAGNPDECAVVLGASCDSVGALSSAARLRLSHPALSVILVRTRVDTAILAECLRAGVREVVESRDLNALAAAVQRAYELREAMTGADDAVSSTASGVLVTSFSTKGGVGKSLVATNLAAAFADLGRRVCLVDLDVQDGDVAIMLQLSPTRTIADLADMIGRVDRTSVESLLIQQSENLSVVAAPPRMDAVDKLSPESVHRVLELLKSMFDVVVVDTSGSFDDYALHALDHSDVVLLVGTLDIPALKSLKVATQTLELLSLPREKWRLVLNRADAKVGLNPRDFEETLGLDIEASMPSSKDVLVSVNAGRVIVRSHPRHPVSQSIKALARALDSGSTRVAGTGQRRAETSHSLLRRRVRS